MLEEGMKKKLSGKSNEKAFYKRNDYTFGKIIYCVFG